MTNINHLTQSIPVTQLKKSPLNVRRIASHAGLDELKASILSHGLIQNLVVTESGDNQYHVIAGGRRLAAIHSLQQEGELPLDFEVPCQIASQESAREMSLAENIVRQAMHPADQFDAFSQLVEEGHTVNEVATRFGVESSLVHRRLKLSKVAPELIELYRSDQLTLECLMAFTVTDDHEAQRAVYESLLPWQQQDPHQIREALTEQLIKASSRRAEFVGLEHYKNAGGLLREDLFGEEVYLENPILLNQLANEKLEAVRDQLLSEGWNWIEMQLERDFSFIHRCTRIRPQLKNTPLGLIESKTELDNELDEIVQQLDEAESNELIEQKFQIQNQLDNIEIELAEYLRFDEDEMRFAGCFVSVGYGGEAFIDKGLVKPEHRKHIGGFAGTPDDCIASAKKQKSPFSASLSRELATARLQVAQLQLVRHPEIALDLLRFQVVDSMLNHRPIRVNGFDVEFRRPKPDAYGKSDLTLAYSELALLAESFLVEWREAQSEAERFEAFRLLSEETKSEMFAYCVAMTLKPKLAPSPGDEITAYDLALAHTSGDVAAYWRPTSETFFSRISREQLLAIGQEILGNAWAQSRVDDKKSTLAAELGRAFAEPEKSGRTPDQIRKLHQWVPIGMSFEITRPSDSGSTIMAA